MSERSITPRGKRWERKQSGWIVASLFGLGGPALIYAGAKVRLNKWIAGGLGFSALQYALPLLFGFQEPFMTLSILAGVVSFVNALVKRKEYLIRLDTVTNIADNDLRRQMARDYGVDPSQLGDRVAGYIPPQNGSFVQLHEQEFGLKRNATPMMRGKPVRNDPNVYYNGQRYGEERSGYSHNIPPYPPPSDNPEEAAARREREAQPKAESEQPKPQNKFTAEPEIYEHTRLMQLDDFFRRRSGRTGANVYFYRISGYNSEIGRFIVSYCEAAEVKGMVIDSKLPPPDNEALLHYESTLGREFSVNEDFVVRCMVRWLPNLEPVRRRRLARSMYNTLVIMQARGLSDSELRNSFIKFMCWIYYRFDALVGHLGEEDLPKLLCEGTPDPDELMMLNLISDAGCDVVLLLYDGEEGYLAVDPASEISDTLVLAGMGAFPEGASLRALRTSRADEQRRYRDGRAFIYHSCTNQWATGDVIDDIAVPPAERGGDPRAYYNVFARIYGVSNRGSYMQELYDLYSELKRSGRGVAVVSGRIEPPTGSEKTRLQGGTFETAEQLIGEMAAKIQYGINPGLQWKMAHSFTGLMTAKAESGCGLKELRETGICLVCWLRRYMTELFPSWDMPQIGAFIYMGGCKSEQEAMFLRLLADLPTDVLILTPGYGESCCLVDDRLLVQENTDFLEVSQFPTDPSLARVGTAAYQAERELDSILYEDSGLFRSRQYDKANAITLKTMYEEIAIFWREELKYRPNFSIADGAVNMPVIFSKISGVKNGDIDAYWEGIHSMITADTVLISYVPYATAETHRDIDYSCRRFLDSGVLQRDAIIDDPKFRYRYLREETLGYMLDKLQQLLDSRVIKGVFGGTGVEFRVVAAVLSMDEYIVRLIQKFDFTKSNPKLIYIQSGEQQASFEDAVIAAFLNLIGFDIVFCVPTGYQSVERCYSTPIIEEHQAGEYMYDLPVPDLKKYVPRSGFEKWQDKFRKK